MGKLPSSVWNRCMKLFSMTRMLGTVSDIGVNRAQTLAFGTLQGECKVEWYLTKKIHGENYEKTQTSWWIKRLLPFLNC